MQGRPQGGITMHIIKRRGWELPERSATPEALVLNRRGVLGGTLALATAGLTGTARAAGLTAPRDPKFDPGRAITPQQDVTTYNNYYEFSEGKDCWPLAKKMVISDPWSIQIDGLVKQPRTIAFDDLMKQVQLEERVYRHRCVEAWSMVVPWDGFPMKKLAEIAEPLGSAKYMVFTTVEQPKTMPGLSNPIYPWPYVEAVTMAEAANDLAFISVGMYGKSLPNVSGAPIRMTLPWKYGFKSGKAFVKVSFVEKRPATMWAQIAPSEYGFWANVNPAVPHPRWSQASERVLGSDERVPTKIYNGYGDDVSSLYAGIKGEKLFM
jgi:methionine sulfoxide reductase catalytic subunit